MDIGHSLLVVEDLLVPIQLIQGVQLDFRDDLTQLQIVLFDVRRPVQKLSHFLKQPPVQQFLAIGAHQLFGLQLVEKVLPQIVEQLEHSLAILHNQHFLG